MADKYPWEPGMVVIDTDMPDYLCKITYLTPKQVVVHDHQRYNRETGERIGERGSLRPPTEADYERVEREGIIRYFTLTHRGFWNKFSTRQLRAMYKIVKEKK